MLPSLVAQIGKSNALQKAFNLNVLKRSNL